MGGLVILFLLRAFFHKVAFLLPYSPCGELFSLCGGHFWDPPIPHLRKNSADAYVSNYMILLYTNFCASYWTIIVALYSYQWRNRGNNERGRDNRLLYPPPLPRMSKPIIYTLKHIN